MTVTRLSPSESYNSLLLFMLANDFGRRSEAGLYLALSWLSDQGRNTTIMKRFLVTLPALFVCLLLAGTNPTGQRGPALSSDLAGHPAGAHTQRVIVQGPAHGLGFLRGGLAGILKRDLCGAVAIEVNDAQLEALKRNPLYTNISGDLPVVA